MYLSTISLVPRYVYRCDPYYNNCHSRWNRWGRWVLAGLLIAFFFFLLLALLLFRRRRRSRARFNTGATPMVPQPAPGNYANGGGYYNQSYAAPPGPPPLYGNENAYGAANGYYAGQTGGVTQPGNAYRSK